MLIDELLYNDRSDKQLKTALAASVRFQIDNVAKYVHENNRTSDNYRIQDHIPNVAPLAPHMWFECNGISVDLPASMQLGCLLSVIYTRGMTQINDWGKNTPPDGTRWILRAEYFRKWPIGLGASDWVYYIHVGDEGQILGTSVSKGVAHGGVKFTPDEGEKNTWHADIIMALTSVCFAHCKGIVIEEHQPTRQVKRALQRAGKPIFSFRTLDIRPPTNLLQTEGHVSENGLARALHICRGHFAHYTEEHPLFGKYTGTFYRPMHVRGSASQGIAAKDYRIHPSGGKIA